MNITILYYTCNFPLIFVRNCDNSRFLGYVLTFSTFEHTEMKSRCEYPVGTDDLEVGTLGEGIPSKRTKAYKGGVKNK